MDEQFISDSLTNLLLVRVEVLYVCVSNNNVDRCLLSRCVIEITSS